MLWGTQISKPNTKDYDAGFGVSLATIPSSSSDKTTAAEERVSHNTIVIINHIML